MAEQNGKKNRICHYNFDREGSDRVVKILPPGPKGPELSRACGGIISSEIWRPMTLVHFQGQDPERSGASLNGSVRRSHAFSINFKPDRYVIARPLSVFLTIVKQH
jgi:hypothetical protein